MPTDPFTEVYDELWTLLENCKDFTDRVRLANRIDLTEDKVDPLKSQVQTSDLPEALLFPSGGGGVAYTSTGIRIAQNYTLRVVSGQIRLHLTYLPIKWAVLKALTRYAGDTQHSYVKSVDVVDSPDALDADEEGRGTRGWAFAMTIQVEMHWSLDDLREVEG